MTATIKSQVKQRVIPKLDALVARMYAEEMWDLGGRLNDALDDLVEIVDPPKTEDTENEDVVVLIEPDEVPNYVKRV